MNHDNLIENIYTTIPPFKEWIEKNGGYDTDLHYPVFFALANYFKEIISTEKKEIAEQVSIFIENMAQSKDEKIQSLLSDFLSHDEFLLGDFHTALAEHLKPESKKLFENIYSSYISRE